MPLASWANVSPTGFVVAPQKDTDRTVIAT